MILLGNEFAHAPETGCALSNIKEGEYYSSFEDRKNHVKVKVDGSVEYGECYLLDNVETIENTISNPSSFDYKQYMKSKKIIYEASGDKVISAKSSPLLNLKKIRRNAIAYGCEEFTKTCSYVNTLILGENQIEDYSRNLYGRIGIAPLFAISGMHINIIYEFIIYVLSKCRVVISKAEVFATLFVAVYTVIAGSSIGVMRAFLMIFFRRICKLKAIYALLLTIAITLFINPFVLVNKAYLLSYTITAFLLIARNHLGKNPIVISMFCYLISLPISYSYSYTINLLAPLAMFVFVPLIMYVILPLSVIMLLFPNTILNAVICFVINIINFIARLFDIATLNPGHIFGGMWLLYCLIIFLSIKINLRYILLILIWTPVVMIDFGGDSVSFIDVGQGDSALVQVDGLNVLVDVGNNDSELINYLAYEGVTKIDAIVLSHAHLDHYGAMDELTKYVKVEKVFELSGNQIVTNSIPVSSYQSNQIFELIPYYGSNDNDRELIMTAQVNGVKYLFPGDVEAESEDYLVRNYCSEIDSDVIKVPHHGSDTSSSDSFLDCVSPKLAIISSGVNNRYHHPNTKIVEKYEQRGLVYDTQFDGEIEVKSDKIKSEKKYIFHV